MLEFGPDDLRAWRKACGGVTQARLARALGIGLRSIEHYEGGTRPIPALLPPALVAIEKPLRAKLQLEARRKGRWRRRPGFTPPTPAQRRANIARRKARTRQRFGPTPECVDPRETEPGLG